MRWNFLAFPQTDKIESTEGPVYFQQDGFPPHFHNHVRHVLKDKLQEREPIEWRPRSPDLAPQGYFRVTRQKHCVFREEYTHEPPSSTDKEC
ncbi:hypothetical protein J6590_053333 [Homalodisca vitripennis]|nr:hypothetical protein J6590_053333 [Homalodisca vitripennis]